MNASFTDFAGETSLAPGYTIGYLEQEPELEAGKTVMEMSVIMRLF